MTLIQAIAARASRGSRHAQVALAVGSAERVVPIYEEYWSGIYTAGVTRAVEVGWVYACGDPINQTEAEKLIVELQDLVTFYEDDGISVLGSAVTASLRVIAVDGEQFAKAIARSLVSALDAAQSAEAMANHGVPRAQQNIVALPEEEAWQDAALSLIAGWQRLAERDMFDSIGTRPPAWLVDWRVRSVR